MTARFVLTLGLLLLLPLAAAAPEQVRLGFTTPDPSGELVVSWFEQAPNLDPRVTLTGPDGEARAFPATRVDGPTAGFVYEARLTGLIPGAHHTYDVGGRSFAFRAPGDDGAFTFAALGDMGVRAQSAKSVDALRAIAPDLVIHPGDLSYGEGDQLTWNAWFAMTEPIASVAPWIPAIGNHEATVIGADADGASPVNPAEQEYYKQRFALPPNEFWFSFDWEGAHFVALDTYTQPTIAQAQVDWLAQDLAANADATWTVVFFHEPPYSSNSHGQSAEAQAAFVALFDEHAVDLVVNAHDHGYERTWPIRDGAAVVREGDSFAKGMGTIYVVTGGGGESLYSRWDEPAPEWSAARESLYHVTEFRVTPDDIEARVVPTDDSGFADAFRIVRGATSDDGTGAPAAVLDNGAPGLPLALALVALGLVARLRRHA